jgi:putative ABC transport system permease protein
MITITAVVAALAVHSHYALSQAGFSAPGNPRAQAINHVLLLITGVLVALAAVNTVFITWATVADARRPAALARALGATTAQVTAGLQASLLAPALAGAVLGVPAGIALVTGLTAGPARVVARRPPAQLL